MAVPKLAMIPSGYKAGKLYSILPTDGTGDFTVARNSPTTRTNVNGVIETIGVNVPILDYPTIGGCPELVCEPQVVQLLELTETLATQTKTVTAVAHTLSFYGTGSISLSGAFVGSLVGTGVNNRVTLTFTPTASPLTLTVTGSVTKGNLYTGSVAYNYIPNATTGIVTKVADLITGQVNVANFNSAEGTLMLESRALINGGSIRAISISDGGGADVNIVEVVYSSNINQIQALMYSSGVNQANIIATGIDTLVNHKIAIVYKLNSVKMFIDGIQIGVTDVSATMPLNISVLNFKNAGSGVIYPFYGKIKQLKYYTTALSDAELITLTT